MLGFWSRLRVETLLQDCLRHWSSNVKPKTHRVGGWHSTKLHLALIAMALISLAYAFTRFSEGVFGTYCTALIAATGVYSGTAAAEKFVKPKPPA